MKNLMLFILMFIPLLVFGEEVPAEVKLTWYETASAFLAKMNIDIEAFINGSIMATVGLVAEVVLRKMKSKKALGLIHGVKAVAIGVVKLLELLISGADRIVPQNSDE